MNGARLAGGPLRFLVLVLGGWVATRGAMLWPTPDHTPEPIAQSPARPGASAITQPMAAFLIPPAVAASTGATPWPMVVLRRSKANGFMPPDHDRIALALLDMVRFGPPVESPSMPGPVAVTPPQWPKEGGRVDRAGTAPVTASRWSGSFWLIARGGAGPTGGLSGSQLGGSQVGGRIAYALGGTRRVALVARISSPLGGLGQEGSIGVEWRPTRLPVRLVAEQRIDLSTGRSAPAVGIVGGAGPIDIGHDFRLEGYGQAGVIARDGGIGYVDGTLRLSRRILTVGQTEIELGAGAWGAKQPGAARLDVGPSITVAVPIARRRVRASLDWRQRVAGAAAPGSGLALSIGADF